MRPWGSRKRSLRGYEGGNLLFFFLFMIALGAFVAFVFRSYKNPTEAPPTRSDESNGVLSEAVDPASGVCFFYLNTRISAGRRRYRGPQEIPATDDGLVRELFAIPGVTEVIVDESLIVLQKSAAAPWERIQGTAREVINSHLHVHQ